MDKAVIVDINNVTKMFGGLCAVNDFSGHVFEDQIIGIIGPNGAGKTTILNMVSGIYPPTSGEIIFKGKTSRDSSLTRLTRWELREHSRISGSLKI
jgi:branched-chain amino acid transport system ATP-binding protein